MLKVLELGRAGFLAPGPMGFLRTLEGRKERPREPVDDLLIIVFRSKDELPLGGAQNTNIWIISESRSSSPEVQNLLNTPETSFR